MSHRLVTAMAAIGVLLGCYCQTRAEEAMAVPDKTGLCLWLDASDPASLELDAQGRVLTWRDRSGAGNAAVAEPGPDDARPLRVATGMNGRPVVRFSGAQAMLVDKAIRRTGGTAMVFVVSQRHDDQGSDQLWQRLISSRGDTSHEDNQSPNFCVMADQDGQAKPYAAAIYDAEQAGVLIGPLAIGRTTAGKWQYLRGDIAEVLVYDRAFLSEGEMQTVLQYLHTKWNARIARQERGWTRTGELDPTPRHERQDLPLSDQANKGNWVLVPQFTDEFDSAELDTAKWHRAWTKDGDWAGRQPAWFDPDNVFVRNGKLSLVFRKAEAPERFRKDGYHTYTSAFVRTEGRSGYGYYEVKAKPMNSAGSSSFWFTDTGRQDNQTEIDVFEIGGAARNFDRKYNMNAHVWTTPAEKRHWAVGGVWIAPWRFADDFHVYGFEWNKEQLIWYVDGVPVRRMANTNWHLPMWICFDSEAMWSWFGQVNDADLPSTFQVEYLRVWRQGGSDR